MNINNIDLVFFDEVQEKSHSKARSEFLRSNKFKNMTYEEKIEWSKQRINEFFDSCDKRGLKPEISFSGGKDSSVLLHLVRSIREDITAVISAELFHPENSKLIINTCNKKIYQPVKHFDVVIKQYGYPIISKEVAQRIAGIRKSKSCGKWIRAILGLGTIRPLPIKYSHMVDTEFNKDIEASHECCNWIKGAVKHSNSPKFVGTTIHESKLRKSSWIKDGCNILNKKNMACRPISLWTEDDVFRYIKENNVNISKAYEMGWNRTGCLACGFGMNEEARLKKKDPTYKTRFQLLYENYPDTYHRYMYELGVAKALIESGVCLNNGDEIYDQEFNKRIKEIEKWHEDIESNINKVLDQIEKRTNAKKNKNVGIAGIDYHMKNNQSLEFTNEERQKIIERFKGKKNVKK